LLQVEDAKIEGRMAITSLDTGYRPRPLQDEMHINRKRFNVFPCHRRFGKTVWAINDMLDMAHRNLLKNPQYAYFAPYHGQAKRVAWEYVKEYSKMVPGIIYNEAELRVTIPRPKRNDKITIYLLGADNPTAILGMYFDGVILDEFGEFDPMVWTRVIRPTLADRRGGAVFIGTVKGQNHFYDVYQAALRNASGDWYCRMFKASETGIIAESELQELKAAMSENEYRQEMECDWSAALIGAYYGKEMQAAEEATPPRVTSVPYEATLQVDCAWDLGIDDSTVIWFFQQVGREVRAIDYLEDAGQGLPFYADALKKKGYSYGMHYLPHDVAARDLSTGRSRQEVLRTLGVTPVTIIPRMAIEDRINASRVLIPKMWFDKVKCERGIATLKNYERKYDTKNKIFLSSPLHNWASHGADAFGHYALGYREESKKSDRQRLPRQTESEYNIFE
jgi:phage terminase large subunit